jgi:hypothetical protein
VGSRQRDNAHTEDTGYESQSVAALGLWVRLNMVREPPEHEVPLDERKGGPLLYALNQLGVFILVTSPVPATVINGVQINHAVVYVKLGNTNGATGTQRGLWMDPHRTDGRTLEVDKADFADTEEAKARLRTAVNEYMGERTTVVSAWRVYDANQSYGHGFAAKDKCLAAGNWKFITNKQE